MNDEKGKTLLISYPHDILNCTSGKTDLSIEYATVSCS